MRIALVTRRYPPQIGGAEKVLSYLAAAMAFNIAGLRKAAIASGWYNDLRPFARKSEVA